MSKFFDNLFPQAASEDPTILSKRLFLLIENWKIAEQTEDELMVRVGDLIGRGADINYKNEEYSRSNFLRLGDLKVTTLPQIAVQKRFCEVVRKLLQEGADSDGLLVRAIGCGDAKMINVLAEEGVNFQENINGLTPLIYAAEILGRTHLSFDIREENENLTEVSKALIKGGAVVEENLLELAASHPAFLGVVKILIEKDGSDAATEVLLFAAANYNPEAAKFALTKGANVEGNEGEDSPLHLAVTKYSPLRSKELVAILMQANASLGKEDQDGLNVLRKAATRNIEMSFLGVLDRVVSLSAMLQVQSPENWEVVKQALEANQNYKNSLSPQNKKMFLVCSLGEGEILEGLKSLEKFSEMKQALLSQFKSAQQSNPMGLANVVVAELILNPEKLKEVAKLCTVVASPQPRSASVKGAEKYSILGNKLSQDVLLHISSFVGLSSYLPKEARDVASNALQIFFNPKRQLPESEKPSSSADAFDSSKLANGKKEVFRIG